MEIVIEGLREEKSNDSSDLIATIDVAGSRTELTMTRYGNHPRLLDSEPSYEPFLLMLLLPAMKWGMSIRVAGEIDETLLYQVNSTIQLAVQHCLPKLQLIRVSAEPRVRSAQRMTLPAATGCSGGVDSMHVLKHCHLERTVPSEFHLGVLVHHEVGAAATPEQAKNHFRHVGKLADQFELPLVGTRCDVDKFYKDLRFEETHVLRNAAASLSLGHLYSHYLYASARSLAERLKGDHELVYQLLLPALGTAANQFHLFGMELNRVERMQEALQNDSLAPWLDVCARFDYDNSNYINCGRCIKCFPLLLVAESINRLDLLQHNFDLDAFARFKKRCYANLAIKTFGPGGWNTGRICLQFLRDRPSSLPWWLAALAKTL